MNSATVKLIEKNETKILKEWLDKINESNINGLSDPEEKVFEEETKKLLEVFVETLSPGNVEVSSKAFSVLRKTVTEFAKKNTAIGYSAKECTLYIFSLKEVLFNLLLKEYKDKPNVLINEVVVLNKIVDELGSNIYDTYVNDKEEIIRRQRQELMEAATPIIKIWDGILGIPIIGTIDSVRAQQIMDILLNEINNTGFDIAIIDISGVSTLDTLTAQYLLKTSAAARLMGATCIISGISPNIAQTIISLDVDLGSTITKGSMSEAIKKALDILHRKNNKEKIDKDGQLTDFKDRQDIDGLDTRRHI